jgi:hypothetical protein
LFTFAFYPLKEKKVLGNRNTERNSLFIFNNIITYVIVLEAYCRHSLIPNHISARMDKNLQKAPRSVTGRKRKVLRTAPFDLFIPIPAFPPMPIPDTVLPIPIPPIDFVGGSTGVVTTVTTGAITVGARIGEVTGLATGAATGATTGVTTGDTTGLTTGARTGDTTGATTGAITGRGGDVRIGPAVAATVGARVVAGGPDMRGANVGIAVGITVATGAAVVLERVGAVVVGAGVAGADVDTAPGGTVPGTHPQLTTKGNEGQNAGST